MADLAGAFREALFDGDFSRLRAVYAAVFPRMPQPKDKAESEVTLHQARTGANSLPLHKRLYSHAWLTERGMRSALPNELKPPAERIESRIVSAVGVACKSMSSRPDRVEQAAAIEKAMADAAGDAMLNGETDPKKVSALMWAARDHVLRGG